MANYGTTTTHRPSTANPPPPQNEPKDTSRRNNIYTLTLSFPFNIPSFPESAAVRIVRNLKKFSLYYATFIWTVLFIFALEPQREVLFGSLVVMTVLAFLYSLLLRALPNSARFILHRIIDKRIMLFHQFVKTAHKLILTEDAVHLFIVLGATVPIVVLHAVLAKLEDVCVKEETGEMTRLVQEKLGDGSASSDVAQPENLV